MCGRSMQRILSLLRPYMFREHESAYGVVYCGFV